MVLAALLFVMAGVFNGVYPGGPGWVEHSAYGWLTYVFGLLNVVVALWIWRGSERGLLMRIVLAAVFLGIVALLVLSQPTVASLVIYTLTGLVELVILLNAIRVWRLGHALDSRDLDAVFSLDASLPVALPGAAVAPERPADLHPPAVLTARLTWAIGLLSLALAGALVADGIASGFVPGGTEWGFTGKQSGWLVYIFAMVALVVAVRAVHGSVLSLRLLVATGVIVLLERTSFAIGTTNLTGLVLHLVAAALALAMAITAALGLRQVDRARRMTTRIALQHATSAE